MGDTQNCSHTTAPLARVFLQRKDRINPKGVVGDTVRT